MNRMFIVLAVACALPLVSNAGTEIGYSDVQIQSSAIFRANSVQNFRVESVAVTTEPSKIKTIDDNDCTSDTESDCHQTQVIARRPVVQVTVAYENSDRMATEDQQAYVSLSLPQSQFSAAQLSAMKKNGFNTKSVRLKVSVLQGLQTVVDDAKTPTCYSDTESDCPAPAYKQARVRETLVTIAPNAL